MALTPQQPVFGALIKQAAACPLSEDQRARLNQRLSAYPDDKMRVSLDEVTVGREKHLQAEVEVGCPDWVVRRRVVTQNPRATGRLESPAHFVGRVIREAKGFARRYNVKKV